MATDTQIAKAEVQGDVSVKSRELSYEQKVFTHPTYRYMPQYNNNFGQPITITSAQIPITINVPPEVFNLSKSYISATIRVPGVANNYIWYYADIPGSGFIQHIQFYSSTNQYLVDLDNVGNYFKEIKREFSQAELQTMDPSYGFSVNNSLNNVVPALRSGNSIGGGPAPSARSYDEQAYYKVGALGADVIIPVMIPLSLFKNTILANDRDMYFGLTSYLRLYIGTLSKFCYMSTSNADPSAGAPTQVTSTPSVQNLTLFLAVEDNPVLHEQVINKHREGLQYMIPYVQSYKNNNSAGSQTISIQFDQGLGHTLAKVYHSVFNNAEANDVAYDCANNGTLITGASNATANQKTLQFWTQLNGKREQDLTLDCTGNTVNGGVVTGGTFTDYMYQKESLRGSMLENLNVFQYNWSWCSNYSNFGAKKDQEGVQDLVAGIPMTNTPLTWTYNGNNMTSAQYNHYTYAVFMRRLNLNGNGAVVN